MLSLFIFLQLISESYSIRPIRSLLIDNYDSYTYNIYHLLAKVNHIEPYIIYNDAYQSFSDIFHDYNDIDNIVISPGPGSPDKQSDFGVCSDVIRNSHLPILGVCLGHQGIVTSFGGKVSKARTPMHGRISKISHSSTGIFQNIPQEFQVVRYHSLAAEKEYLPSCLQVTAWTDDGVIMGLEHRERPIYGVQFHPESILTNYGNKIAENFRDLTAERLIQSTFTFPWQKKSPLIPKNEVNNKPKVAADSSILYINRINVPHEKTILSIFEYLYGDQNCSFWLDSASNNTFDSGSFSFMGAISHPEDHILEYLGQNQLVLRYKNNTIEYQTRNIFDYLHHSIENHSPPHIILDRENIGIHEQLPFNLTDTWFGYIGYEGRFDTEQIFSTGNLNQYGIYNYSSTLVDRYQEGHKNNKQYYNDLKQPVALLMYPSIYLVYDHQKSQLYIISRARNEGLAKERASVTMSKLNNYFLTDTSTTTTMIEPEILISNTKNRKVPLLTARKTRREYQKDIYTCLDLIRQGETYEVCLTVQFHGELSAIHTEGKDDDGDEDVLEPLDIYRILRTRNPAPYAAYIRYDPFSLLPTTSTIVVQQTDTENAAPKIPKWYRPGGIAILSSSPERYLKVTHNREIESKPIKGTAQRNLIDPEKDAIIASALQQDEKSRAENLMIVDLVRNDFGRVCDVGTVTVPSIMAVETYASVHQLVSTIKGKLRPTYNVIDAIVATFPGGSMTGAPKKRTMEIIDSIERQPRGVYSGAIGYISKNNIMDLNIVIRTAVINGKEMTVSAGGAIVSLSGPVEEIDEVLLKARAVSSSINCKVAFKTTLSNSVEESSSSNISPSERNE